VDSIIPNNGQVYRFDDIVVDGENFRVRRNGRILTLTPRAFDVLLVLLKNSGRAVEKQEIFESVWKDTFVSDNALTKIIRELRHALADSSSAPRFIETVPKRGYRFIGEIKDAEESEIEIKPVENSSRETPRRLEEAAPPRTFGSPRFLSSKIAAVASIAGLILILVFAAWLIRQNPANSADSMPIRSIAVLPFKPLNADSRDESLEMGMAETLITRLSNVSQIVVRPMSSARRYTDPQQDPVKAGREMQAEAVLDGSIQKAGERIRVTVRLIDARRGTTLWSEQFDENFTDIFKVQDSIAERIADALTLQLSRQEKERLARHITDDTDAYQLYLRGQLTWHSRRQNWIEQSLSFYEQAIEKDPNFALAYVGAADCYMMLSGHRRLSIPEAEKKARPLILKALEIDPHSAPARNALAEFKYQYEYDWRAAEKEFKRAIEINPNIGWIRQAYGWFLMSEGRLDEATAEMDKARELDPSSITINVGRGRLYYYSRQYDQAIRHFQNIIAVEPQDGSAYYSLYTIYEQKKMYPEAYELFLDSMRQNGAPAHVRDELQEAYRSGGWEGFLRKHLEKAERREKKGQVNHYTLANLYMRLGRKDEAFVHFKKAFDLRDPSMMQFKIDPAYDTLRGDPRYAELLRMVGLKP
jgi:TolB-like protein/DNA-binding winged helix-turn-helix (wHTH) protein/Tfp pilus assembly protein PilF